MHPESRFSEATWRSPLSRRALLTTIIAAGGVRLLAAQSVDSLAGGGAIGTLGAPGLAGRPMSATTAADNDLAIQTLEKRLRCSCGCGLDIYTCRTTDFTCTYSPQLHQKILGMWNGGKTADQIVAAFVQEYGEKALMAPPPKGFNLAGYLVPGALILMLGAVLAWVLFRRRAVAEEAVAPLVPVVHATDAELAELERAVADAEHE